MRRQSEQEPLSRHTSFRIGGAADYYYEPETAEELKSLLARCKADGIPSAVIGNGSNLLVGDKGFRGAVIRLGEGFGAIEVNENRLRAEAGALLAKLARTAANAGLSGLAFAAGIPGTVGGALVMNAGAYGGEMKDNFRERRAPLAGRQCALLYRGRAGTRLPAQQHSCAGGNCALRDLCFNAG